MDIEPIDIIELDHEIPEPKKKRKKGAGWFWISRSVAETLLKKKASAKEICGYLLLACYTDRTGTFTSVNYRAFRKHLCISEWEAQEIIDSLKAWKVPTKNDTQYLIYEYSNWFGSSANYKSRTSVKAVSYSMFRSKPKWALNTFQENSDDGVWFSKELIEGNRTHRRPLKTLLDKSMGDNCARLLLYLYTQNRLADYWGLDPEATFHVSYDMEKLTTKHGFDFWRGEEKTLEIQPMIMTNLVKYSVLDSHHEIPVRKQLEILLTKLMNYKFFYRIVCVTSPTSYLEQTMMRYMLDIKDWSGMHKNDDIFKMAKRIQVLANDHGHIAGIKGKSDSWRFYKKYIAMVPENEGAKIMGIFRLSYDITLRKNSAAKIYRRNLLECTREARQSIVDFKKIAIYEKNNNVSML